MAKYIDWYLVEMEGMLRGRLRTDEVQDALSEIEGHLREATSDMEARGMTLDEAELGAVERFGRAGMVAEGFLNRRVASVSAKGTAALRLIMCVTAVGLGVIALALRWGPMQADMREPSDWFAYGAMIAGAWSIWASWRSADRRIWPVVGSCLAGLVFGMLVAFPIGLRGVQFGRANQRVGARGEVDRYSKLVSQLDLGVKAFTANSNASLASVEAFRTSDGYVAPLAPKNDGRLGSYDLPSDPELPLGVAPTFEMAKLDWQSRGQKFLDQANENLAMYQGMLTVSPIPVWSYESVVPSVKSSLLGGLFGLPIVLTLIGLQCLLIPLKSPRRGSWVRRRLA